MERRTFRDFAEVAPARLLGALARVEHFASAAPAHIEPKQLDALEFRHARRLLGLCFQPIRQTADYRHNTLNGGVGASRESARLAALAADIERSAMYSRRRL